MTDAAAAGPRVLACSVTRAGAAVAARLPYERRAGDLASTVRARWGSVDAFVLVVATGVAVRVVAPLLAGKATDPAVVCVDDAGRFAVALCGGHAGGANRLAREVAALLGATPVVTTGSDAAGVPALDDLPGWTASGDVAGVTRRWLDGATPTVRVDPAVAGWPLPPAVESALRPAAALPPGGAPVVWLTDAPRGAEADEVVLRPRSVVVGVGVSSGAAPAALLAVVRSALAEAGVHPDSVAEVATLDRKAAHPAVTSLAAALGAAVRGFAAPSLAALARDGRTPTPSRVVDAAVGTPSVCEAAALLAAGPGAALVVPKRVSETRDSTAAVARRPRPAGHLAVVGLGPGDPARRTPEASAAVRSADVVIGYSGYVALAADLIGPHHLVVRSALGEETRRCRDALARAAAGERVALVCSGDAGVYAMASLVLELAPDAGDPPVTVIPGVTAALSAAAALGAPLGHDHAAISLSDLLTPWPVIDRRLRAAAEGDFVVSLYNPRSTRRLSQLPAALDIFRARRPASTPVAVVTNAGRPGEHVVRSTLAGVRPEDAGMLSLVVVGSSATRWIAGRMVTPRGYGGGG